MFNDDHIFDNPFLVRSYGNLKGPTEPVIGARRYTAQCIVAPILCQYQLMIHRFKGNGRGPKLLLELYQIRFGTIKANDSADYQ